jgi:MHS family proline/betaine transporter-like MFS transporter
MFAMTNRPSANLPDREQGLDIVPSSKGVRRVTNVTAAVIGNTLEWFDILVYAAFVPYISATFFPGDRATATLIALGAFGTSFVVRPLGAVFAGWIADRFGRRQALTIVSLLMFVGTSLIAMLPGYARIGFAAPILLVLARLVQGFAAGGEFGTATAYLAEQSHRHRGYYASWQFASQGLGVLIAAFFGAGLTALFSEQALMDWAWRIPFMFGMLVGPMAYVIRYHSDESPEFAARKTSDRRDRSIWLNADFCKRIGLGVGLVVNASATLYLLISLPTLAVTMFGVGQNLSMWTLVCAGGTLLVATPVAGALGDRYGRPVLALASSAALIIAPIALFAILDLHPGAGPLLVTQFVLSLLISVYLGALAAMLSDLFEPAQRSLGLSICYNVAVLSVGAFAPLIYAALGTYVGRIAPSFYTSGAALISLLTVILTWRGRWLPVDRSNVGQKIAF